MPPVAGLVTTRVAAVIPVMLLVLFTGLLWLLCLLCDREQRCYAWLREPAVPPPLRASRRWSAVS
jgi:hypothetical protein